MLKPLVVVPLNLCRSRKDLNSLVEKDVICRCFADICTDKLLSLDSVMPKESLDRN